MTDARKPGYSNKIPKKAGWYWTKYYDAQNNTCEAPAKVVLLPGGARVVKGEFGEMPVHEGVSDEQALAALNAQVRSNLSKKSTDIVLPPFDKPSGDFDR